MTPYASASAEIHAPVELVWQVMLDLGAYGEWNPFVVRVERRGGPAPAVGDPIALHVRFRGGRAVVSNECITAIEPPSMNGQALLEYEFRGPLHTTWMIRGRRRQIVERAPAGHTVYRTEERFRGWLTFAAPIRGVQDGFERHAAALKRRAESLHQAAA